MNWQLKSRLTILKCSSKFDTNFYATLSIICSPDFDNSVNPTAQGSIFFSASSHKRCCLNRSKIISVYREDPFVNRYQTDSSTNSFILLSLFFRNFSSLSPDEDPDDLFNMLNTSLRMFWTHSSNYSSYSGTLSNWLKSFRISTTTLSILYVLRVLKKLPTEEKYGLNCVIKCSVTFLSCLSRWMLKALTVTLKNAISFSPTTHLFCLRRFALVRYFYKSNSMCLSVIRLEKKYGRKNFRFWVSISES